jgi:transcriptional regulator with XRE-family HTH domain
MAMTQEITALPSPLTLRVSAEIRAELARQQKSQRWLAGELGIDPAAVSRRMIGLANTFTTAELDRVAEILQVPVDRLLGAAALAGAA